LRGQPDRADQSRHCLPKEIAKRDPDTIAVLITGEGAIQRIWASRGFNGPLPAAFHVRDFLTPAETDQVMTWIQEALKGRLPVFGQLELRIGEQIRRRKIRILPCAVNMILGYIINISA
jgi:hypothetical protein